MKQLSKNTKDFYNNYPFPQLDDKKILENSKKENFRLLSIGIPAELVNKPIKVLDAGCGTGSFALSFALANPQSEVTATNISQKSLDYAEKQANSLGAKNINFITADIFDLPEEVTSKKYEIVYCSGVLMTTFNPSLGLRILSKLVKQQHYMITGLYHKGRYKVRAMRLILKLLAGNNSEKRIKLARKLFPKHCQHHVSKGFESGTRTRELEDLSLADKFAVPKESYHSFTATNNYLNKLGYKNIYKNVSKPKNRIRRERVIHAIMSFFPFSTRFKEDLADDIIALTVGKEMLLVTSKKVTAN